MSTQAKSSVILEKSAASRSLIEAAGNTTQSLGLGRIIGHILALLYLSPRPLCLDEIVTELRVSKASASTSVRQLERFSAVRRIWVPGDRKDYYEAEMDFSRLLKNGLVGALRQKSETARHLLASMDQSLKESLKEAENHEREDIKIVAERLERAKRFHAKIDGLLHNPLLDHLL